MGGVWPGYTASRAVSAVPYACAAPTGIRATVDPQIVTRPGRGLRRSGGSDVQAAVLACQATPGRSPARPGVPACGRQRYVAGPLPSRLGERLLLPFLALLLALLGLLGHAYHPLPDPEVNKMLTRKRQRTIDQYQVSNTL